MVTGTPAPQASAPLVGVEPVALQVLDAPGFAVDVLTSRLRDAIVRTSGAVVVDALSVRAELAACVQLPCADAAQTTFRGARYIASATLARVGATVLGTARVLWGSDELARVTVRGDNVATVVDALGWQLGARFREAVTAHRPSATAPVGER
jgi:hypothetical protein